MSGSRVLAIAGVNLRRMARDRANIFFVLLFPMLLILVLGLAFGGSFTPRLGVVVQDTGPLAGRLVAALAADDRMRVDRVDSESELQTAVERGELAAGLVVPSGYDRTVSGGGAAQLRYLARPDESGQQVGITVRAVVGEQAAVLGAAGFAAGQTGAPFDQTLGTAEQLATGLPAVTVQASTVGEALFPDDLGQFDIGASSQLLLFVFLTSLVGSSALVEARRLGVTRRMLATPTTAGTILAGEALGRVAVALVQGLIIMLGAGLLFGVSWGDPLGAAALLGLFALAGSGAAMVMGSVFRTVQQASGFGVLLGLALAALGGSMVPIEVFSGTMRTVARFTPHAWANEGFAELVRRDGGVLDIAPQLGVLAGFAVGLFVLGAWLLRRTVLGAPTA
ncbi:MAG: ABC transporter permease subunit [Micromonosporaceae bacterium]|nr:ABC transporter permease subunit [Micromonosporaceae bacterium]